MSFVWNKKSIGFEYGKDNDYTKILLFQAGWKGFGFWIYSYRKNSEKYDLGVKTIEQEGRKGYKVKTYRVYKNDFGNKSEYIGESYYPPQDKIIIYGTRELRKWSIKKQL